MENLSFEQLQIFVTVVKEGSFSAAARALNRAQSVVTYAIRKLEDQLGTTLFDRTEYRPILTEAGRILLPRARQITEDVGAFHAQARGIAGGLEPELGLVVDSIFPLDAVIDTLKAFKERYPTIHTRIYIDSLESALRLVTDDICRVGILIALPGTEQPLKKIPLIEIDLVMVAAADHPLARHTGTIPSAVLREHIQLVLTDRSGVSRSGDHGVLASQTWRLGDLSAKHAMLLAGLGYGSMPTHLVHEDLTVGRLVRLEPEDWEGLGNSVRLPMCAVYRLDRPIGPATAWLLDDLKRAATQRNE